MIAAIFEKFKKYDADEVFAYNTFKVVKVKDRRLGLLYRAFQLAIFAYIIFSIVNKASYLKTEPPIPGAIRVTLKAPTTFTDQPYCTGGGLPCVFWGANEIQYPNDGAGFAFLTTRALVTNYPPPTGCNFLAATSPQDPCMFNSTNPKQIIPKSYIGDIEDYTVMIEHSIRGDLTSISIRNGLMDGELLDSNNNLVKSITNATRTADNSKVDGDIFTVKQILDAAGVDLDALSFAPGSDPGETRRSAGVVIVILINYENVKLKPDTIKYTYRPEVIVGSEYKSVESIYNNIDGSYTIKERHGIRLVFQQTGKIGTFDFVSLLVNLVAALALFKVATTIVELLMLNLLPEKDVYKKFKFKETHDFGDYRDGILDKEGKVKVKETDNTNQINI